MILTLAATFTLASLHLFSWEANVWNDWKQSADTSKKKKNNNKSVGPDRMGVQTDIKQRLRGVGILQPMLVQ